MAEKKKNKESFETSLHALEEVVERLESGDLSLEESLECFEQGVKSAARCRELLGEVTTRVDVLLKEAGGALRTAPFAGLDDEDDAEDED